jgi:hypothetical protein
MPDSDIARALAQLTTIYCARPYDRAAIKKAVNATRQ